MTGSNGRTTRKRPTLGCLKCGQPAAWLSGVTNGKPLALCDEHYNRLDEAMKRYRQLRQEEIGRVR